MIPEYIIDSIIYFKSQTQQMLAHLSLIVPLACDSVSRSAKWWLYRSLSQIPGEIDARVMELS